MSEKQTCGKGLSERAALPARLSELTEALAEVLAFHGKALVLTHESSREELHAYVRLELQFRAISDLLKSAAKEMSGYRSLPMGEHDMETLSSKANAERFKKFVSAERELAGVLRTSIEGDQEMLKQMTSES